MQLHKTERARAELKPGTRTLGQRERTLLLLADGQKSMLDFRPLFNGDGEEIALRLLRDGFLEVPTDDSLRTHIPATHIAADAFEGKRSLATARMFLFDICERMFARRNPETAELFREALRHAKDRDTMLVVSRNMMEEIEAIAGYARADAISERLAMLLPVNAFETAAV